MKTHINYMHKYIFLQIEYIYSSLIFGCFWSIMERKRRPLCFIITACFGGTASLPTCNDSGNEGDVKSCGALVAAHGAGQETWKNRESSLEGKRRPLRWMLSPGFSRWKLGNG